jgi:GH3 auxin-responsive promoter
MAFFNSLLSWFFKQRYDQIQFFIEEPLESQQQVFSKLITLAEDTEWGEKFQYSSIENIQAFKERVPIQDYESLKPYINRTMHGEQNLLWYSDINWFAKSSGTTSDKSKFIPISQDSLDECHYKGGKDLLTLYCYNHPETNIFSGKGLVMGGSHQVNPLNSASAYGDLSAVLNQNMPWLGQVLRTPDLEVALMEDWELKIDKMIATTSKQNVTHIAGVPTWTLVLLQKLLKQSGKSSIHEIWPQLELYIHGGVNFTPYRNQFKQLLKGTSIHFYETYNASEGFFGIQLEPGADDLLLMLDYGVFYEFIPLEQDSEENPRTLQLDEVEIGKLYSLVITTNGGLWRYRIGDTIAFTSLHPFKIKIAGRTKNFINAFGEELMVHNAEEAIAQACIATGAVLNDYTACPVYMNDGSAGTHEWFIEFEKAPDSLTSFTVALDNFLKANNSDYEAKRQKDMAMSMPIIRPLPSGVFYQWLKQKNKLGGQHKIPRLCNDRKIAEEILALL